MKEIAEGGIDMYRQLVMIRHGESVWNRENLFTGWTDVDLSRNGKGRGMVGRHIFERGEVPF